MSIFDSGCGIPVAAVRRRFGHATPQLDLRVTAYWASVGKRPIFQMERDTGLRKVLIWHFAYLDPCPIEGAWSCLYRDMERGTLFLYRKRKRKRGGLVGREDF